MPIYAYKCESCAHAKDVLQKISDPLLTVCPACGAPRFKKQLTAAGFQLKGSGWYVTDFKGGAGAAASGKTGAEADSGKGDSKSDTKTGESAAASGSGSSGASSDGKSGSAPSPASPSSASSAATASSNASAAPAPSAAKPAAPASGA